MTDKKAVATILKSGLSKMSRTHIHFAQDSNLLRKGKSVIIKVNMESAMAAGIKFYLAVNNVILSSGNEDGIIPAEHLTVMVDKENKKKLSEKDERKKKAYATYMERRNFMSPKEIIETPAI